MRPSTGFWLPGGCAAGSAQEQWLRADLAASTDEQHHRDVAQAAVQLDGALTHAFMQPLWQALYDGGADIVLGGHWHNYERLAPMDATGAS